MNDKLSFGFVFPLAAWIGAHAVDINAVLQGLVFIVAIIGGFPSFLKGCRAIHEKFFKRKE